MVEKNPVNLLKEIQKITKCNLIIFTTYSFDPFFFDHMLLRKLRENNPQADIIVLVDQAHLNLENATSATGIKYSLVSLPSTFHPKLFIFCSDRGNTAFIGSHNVTLTGFTQNLELSCKITDDKISKECLLYIRNVLGQFFEPNHKWLEKISNSIKQENKISSKQPDTYFIQNIETPILDQALEILKSKQAVIKEITIVAPFFSSVYQIVKKLRQTTNIKKVNLCVQLNNHNLEIDDVNELRYVNFMKVCTKRKRPLHCKIILFKGQKTSFLLVGSPNFTKAALLKASQNQGNYETALLIRKNDAELKKIFAELNLKKVGKKEIRDSKREEEQNEGTKDLLITLFFAEYDPDHLTVDLKTSNNISNLKLCFEKPNGKLEVYAQPFKIDANQKRIKIPLIDGFPTGSIIWFSRDEKQISNKVAVAIPQIFKPIDITADTFSKISSMIDSSKNIGDLLHIMIKLFPLEIEEATEFSRPESKELTSLSLPSGDKSYGSRVLDLIEQILKLPRVKRNLKEY